MTKYYESSAVPCSLALEGWKKAIKSQFVTTWWLISRIKATVLTFCGDKSFSPVKLLEHVIVAHTSHCGD
jgi:hypothetical protein